MFEEFNEKFINEHLGSPVDISILKNGSIMDIDRLAFDLYKEASIIGILASNIIQSVNPDKEALSLNQAVEAGLIVRIVKFMGSVLALSVDKIKEHGDVILALNRCVLESAINLKFFCEYATQQDIDEFIKSSLRPEMDTYNLIQENITKRGKSTPMEDRILKSINKTFQASGVKDVSELGSIPRRKNYKDILKKMDMVKAYPLLQGIPSHAVHGTWVDLLLSHLELVPIGFMPHVDSRAPDPRFFCPTAILTLEAIKSYIKKNFPVSNKVIEKLVERVDDLMARIDTVDNMHETYLSKK